LGESTVARSESLDSELKQASRATASDSIS